MDDWLEEELDSVLGFTIKSPAGVIYASNLGDDPRLLFLRYLGLAEEKIDATTARKMGAGEARHTRWAKDLAKAGLLVVAEKNVQPSDGELRVVHGRLDFIARSRVQLPRKPFLIELKNVADHIWRATKEPAFGALCQWVFYSCRENIPDGYVLYENFGTQQVKYFRIMRDQKDVHVFCKGVHVTEWPNLVARIDEKIKYVLWCATNDRAPERCPTCVMSTCKQPSLCSTYEGKVISLAGWREQYGQNIRPSS